MRNIRLWIEYDGTDFCGWQVQPNGVSVQQTINEALSRMEGREASVTGAGRTDSGVHARCQAGNFFTESRIPAEKYRDALNALLPDSIRILKSEEVSPDFNARFSAKKKTYKYYVRNSDVKSALNCRYEYHVQGKIDIEKMQEACSCLVGEHDFAAFMAAGSTIKDTVRTIFEASAKAEGSVIEFTFTGNGFLYKMVRLMVGTLLDIGRGKHPPEYIRKLLDGKGKERATLCAPPQGLFVDNIEYGE